MRTNLSRLSSNPNLPRPFSSPKTLKKYVHYKINENGLVSYHPTNIHSGAAHLCKEWYFGISVRKILPWK
jgi:hypothetical protein